MGKQPAISIIIPAYKVEAWVERSVQSQIGRAHV